MASFIPGARFTSGYPVTVTVVPELLAVGAKISDAVVPAPTKLFESVSVVPEIELTTVPAASVVLPRLTTTVIPMRIPFIEPVMTQVFTPFEMVVAVIAAVGAGMIQLFVTS
jgi:hypothetical protein